MHDKRPPRMTRHELMPPIRTQADLRQHWRALMGPLGFTRRSLWLLFVDSDAKATNVLTRVEDLPLDPETETLRNIMYVAGQVLESTTVGGSLACVAAVAARPWPVPRDRPCLGSRADPGGCRGAGADASDPSRHVRRHPDVRPRRPDPYASLTTTDAVQSQLSQVPLIDFCRLHLGQTVP
jgi:hypothetical protein